MATSWPRPSCARASARRVCSISASRPTKRVSPPGGGDVEPASLGAGSRERVDLDGIGQPPDRDRSPRRNLHVAFGEVKRGGGKQDGAGRRHLFHAGGQMGRLSHRRVVHVQVGADGTHDDLARVEAHADLDGHALGTEDSLRVLRY